MESLSRRGFGKLAAGLAAAALIKPAAAEQAAPAQPLGKEGELEMLLTAAQRNQTAASAARRSIKLKDCSEPCFQFVPQKRTSK